MASSTSLHFNSLLLLLLFLPVLPIVFIINNSDCQIKVDPSLSAQSWNSSSKEFTFGIRTVQFGKQGNISLLAIWFTRDLNQTIVWFAKDGAAPAGSTPKLTNKGVAVYDPQGNQKWRRPKHENSQTFCATMQDDGNFVLLDKDGNHLWESFEETTDTILPGQKLNLFEILELTERL